MYSTCSFLTMAFTNRGRKGGPTNGYEQEAGHDGSMAVKQTAKTDLTTRVDQDRRVGHYSLMSYFIHVLVKKQIFLYNDDDWRTTNTYLSMLLKNNSGRSY